MYKTWDDSRKDNNPAPLRHAMKKNKLQLQQFLNSETHTQAHMIGNFFS